MIKLIQFLGFILLVLVSSRPAAGQIGDKDTPGPQFNFVILSDIHINDNESKSEKLKNFINFYNENLADESDFVITTGDNVSYLLSDRKEGLDVANNNKLRSFIQIMSELSDRFFLCMGNHEYKIDAKRDSDGVFPKEEILNAEKIWMIETGLKPYYTLEENGYTLLFLNSMRGRFEQKFFDNKQIDWLEQKLKKSPKVLLFFHHPVETDNISHWYKKEYGTITKKTEPKLFELLSMHKDKIMGVFVGHGHQWIHDKLMNTIEVYETASFGDNDEFAYYKVSVSSLGIQVEKSIELPWFEGFTPVIKNQDE